MLNLWDSSIIIWCAPFNMHQTQISKNPTCTRHKSAKTQSQTTQQQVCSASILIWVLGLLLSPKSWTLMQITQQQEWSASVFLCWAEEPGRGRKNHTQGLQHQAEKHRCVTHNHIHRLCCLMPTRFCEFHAKQCCSSCRSGCLEQACLDRADLHRTHLIPTG